MGYVSSFELDFEQKWDNRMTDYHNLLQQFYSLMAEIEDAGRDIPENVKLWNEKIKKFCADKKIN